MSIVIIGGNERMVCQYTDICKDYGYKAKVFPKENGAIRKKIGCPDLMVLFTNTVSHKMVISASQEAKKNNIPVARQVEGKSIFCEQALCADTKNSRRRGYFCPAVSRATSCVKRSTSRGVLKAETLARTVPASSVPAD